MSSFGNEAANEGVVYGEELPFLAIDEDMPLGQIGLQEDGQLFLCKSDFEFHFIGSESAAGEWPGSTHFPQLE